MIFEKKDVCEKLETYKKSFKLTGNVIFVCNITEIVNTLVEKMILLASPLVSSSSVNKGGNFTVWRIPTLSRENKVTSLFLLNHMYFSSHSQSSHGIEYLQKEC